jgi:hypothetical protein
VVLPNIVSLGIRCKDTSFVITVQTNKGYFFRFPLKMLFFKLSKGDFQGFLPFFRVLWSFFHKLRPHTVDGSLVGDSISEWLRTADINPQSFLRLSECEDGNLYAGDLGDGNGTGIGGGTGGENIIYY